MGEEKKKQAVQDEKQRQRDKFHEHLHQKAAKQEWKTMQDNMLKSLSDRLRRWRYKGTWDARRELHDLLTACSAAL